MVQKWEVLSFLEQAAAAVSCCHHTIASFLPPSVGFLLKAEKIRE